MAAVTAHPRLWVTAAHWPSFIEKSALRADSFLTRLSDDEFAQRIAAFRAPGYTINQNDAVTEEIDWFVLPGMGEGSGSPALAKFNKRAMPAFPSTPSSV